ncbi:MAG TPA: hypothetical protein VFR23_04115 [Jiangellaceae bacterium]|nr:hypothetical protein [Jiangellaceae bacterium]
MAELPELDMPWMTEQTTHIVLSAVDGEGERCVDLLTEIGERYGGHGVYCLCCALAEAIARMAEYKRDDDPGNGQWGLRIEHVERGRIEPEDLTDDTKPMLQAMRFVTAWLNSDSEQTLALFYAAETPKDAVIIPTGLIKLVGIYGRYRLEQGADDADA